MGQQPLNAANRARWDLSVPRNRGHALTARTVKDGVLAAVAALVATQRLDCFDYLSPRHIVSLSD